MTDAEERRDALDVLASELEESTGDAVVLVGPDLVVRRWSAEAVSLTGVAAEKALGAPLAQMLPHPASTDPLIATLARGEPWAFVPDPALAIAQRVWTARPSFQDDGTFAGAIVRISAETPGASSAIEPNAMALLALDAASEHLTILDRRRRLVFANAASREATTRALGRPLEIGEDFVRAVAPGLETTFLQAFERALRGEKTLRKRVVRYANGEEFEHVFQYSPLIVGGRTEAVLFGSSAVSMAGAPSLDRAILERALAVAPFVVLVADARQPDFPIVFVTGALEKITGYTPDEVLGRNARLFQGRLRSQPALDIVRRALATGTACDLVLQNERKDGAFYWNRLSLTPVRDELGVVSHFIGIQEEVTEREELLRKLQAAESSETANRMLGGAVHDLRNLLAAVMSRVEYAKLVTEDDGLSEVLSEAVSTLEQAGALTAVLLTPVARIRSVAGFASLDVVMESVAMVCRYAIPPGIRLVIGDVPAGAKVLGDRAALEHVLLNLVFNARDVMTAGTIRIEVGAEVPEEARPDIVEREGEGRYWTIAVTDDGPGMTPEIATRVFEPYFTTKAPGKGTGLGLATSASLVAAAGGLLRLRTEPGRGSTFFVVLPRAREPDATPEVASDRSLVGLATMVVDADTLERANVSTTLRRSGAVVQAMGDATRARAAMASAEPRALLVITALAREADPDLVSAWLAASPSRCAIVLGPKDAAHRHDFRIAYVPTPVDLDALLLAARKLCIPPSA